MFFEAKFKVKDKEYNVLRAEYGFEQGTDEYGQPTTVVRGGKITITVQATEDVFLSEWVVDPHMRNEATLTYLKRTEAGATAKEITFIDAYCVGYTETFDAKQKDNPTIETITISAKGVNINDVEHRNEWTLEG